MSAPVLPARLGAKGRLVLPAAIREAAHLEEGSVLLVRNDGEGRILLESAEAVRQRIWDAAPSASEGDATADLRVAREQDARLADEHSARRSEAGARTRTLSALPCSRTWDCDGTGRAPRRPRRLCPARLDAA